MEKFPVAAIPLDPGSHAATVMSSRKGKATRSPLKPCALESFTLCVGTKPARDEFLQRQGHGGARCPNTTELLELTQ